MFLRAKSCPTFSFNSYGLKGLAKQPTLSRSSIALAADFESTRKRTEKGALSANLNRLEGSFPIAGVTPRIKRSTSRSVSANEKTPFPKGLFATTNSRPKIRARVSRTTSDSSMTKIRFACMSAPVAYLTNRLTSWQIYTKCCSNAGFTLNRDVSSMFLDNLMRNRKPQAAALVFAGKKWIEDMIQVLRWYPYPCIADFNLDELA